LFSYVDDDICKVVIADLVCWYNIFVDKFMWNVGGYVIN